MIMQGHGYDDDEFLPPSRPLANICNQHDMIPGRGRVLANANVRTTVPGNTPIDTVLLAHTGEVYTYRLYRLAAGVSITGSYRH